MGRLKNTDVDFEKVHIWLTNPDAPELSDNEKQVYEILLFVDRQLMHFAKINEVVIMLQKRFGLSRSVAYTYIKNSQNIFNSTNKIDKEYLKRWLVDKGMKLFLANLRVGDLKEAGKNYESICKYLGFNKEDSDLLTMEDIQPKQIFIQMNIAGDRFQMPYSKWEEMPNENIFELLQKQENDISPDKIVLHVK